MKGLGALAVFSLLLLMSAVSTKAYFNTTALSTTVFLTNSTTAHVVEGIELYVSNSSLGTYTQDRQAFNLSLSNWQKATGSPFLTEHILNPYSSISNFTFLPGPIVSANNSGGYASLTMSYYVSNVTSEANIAPRQFEYSLNPDVFNFLHTASGQALPANARLTLIVPNGTRIVGVYPAPDFPLPSAAGNYTGTQFAWYSGEPLQNFQFSYIITQTPQQEVMSFFSDIYDHYAALLYLLLLLFLVAVAVYAYNRFFK
jgi:hypothetical protein